MQMPETVWYTSPYSSGLRQNGGPPMIYKSTLLNGRPR